MHQVFYFISYLLNRECVAGENNPTSQSTASTQIQRTSSCSYCLEMCKISWKCSLYYQREKYRNQKWLIAPAESFQFYTCLPSNSSFFWNHKFVTLNQHNKNLGSCYSKNISRIPDILLSQRFLERDIISKSTDSVVWRDTQIRFPV